MSEDEKRARRWLTDHLNIGPNAFDRLACFASALIEENARQNLIAAASASELWWRHIVDSAQLLGFARNMQPGNGPWVDLGTGAGFPGLIIGILDEQRPMLLVEERRRRVDWLTWIAAELQLAHVTVVGSSVEKMSNPASAIISARAFAPMSKLLRLSARLSTPQTIWLLPKGERALQEVEELPEDVRAMFHVKQSITHPAAGIVLGRGVPPLKRRGVQTC